VAVVVVAGFVVGDRDLGQQQYEQKRNNKQQTTINQNETNERTNERTIGCNNELLLSYRVVVFFL